MKTWFLAIAALALTPVALAAGQTQAPHEVSIYDEIGAYGVNGKDYMDAFNALPPGDVIVNINTPGGSVFDALAMMNGMRASGRKITTRVMGIAASAGSYIAMAGDRIEMPENTYMMVHNPMTMAYGNADEMRSTAQMLETIGSSMHATYAKRTGRTTEQVAELLAKDTYLTAQECKDLGLCDVVTPAVAVSAKFDPDLKTIPKHVQAMLTGKPPAPSPAPAPAPAPAATLPMSEQIVAACKVAGLEAHAAAFAFDNAISTPEALATAVAEAKEIIALCTLAGTPEAGPKAVDKRMTLADLRAELVTARVEANKAIRVTATPPADPKPADAGVSGSGIWANVEKVNAEAAKARGVSTQQRFA